MKLKVSGLTEILGNMGEQDIRNIFQTFGTIELIEVPRDPNTGKNLGYAYVTYTNNEDAHEAIAGLNNVQMKGKTIQVQECREEDSDDDMRPSAPKAQLGNASTCLLINNMFDPESDEAKDEGFFKDIEAEVFDMAEEYGQVDRVWVDNKSTGNVWIKFAQESLKGAQEACKILNKKKFDNRELRVSFVTPAVFNMKVPKT